MKVVHKPHSPALVKVNHTPQGGGHPLPPRKHRPIKDSKFFKKKPKRSKK